MKLTNSIGRQKLLKAVRWHNQQLGWVRTRREESVNLCAGDRYSRDDTIRKTIVGLSRQALEAHVLDLAANMPRVLISAKRPSSSPFAREFTAALNVHLAEIHFRETLQSLAYDSFFPGGAFAKCYLAESLNLVEEDHDVWVDPGRGYVERKSIDDLVYDTNATDFRKCTFVCDRYQLSLEALLENKQRFSRRAVEVLHPTKRHEENESRYISGSSDNDSAGKFVDMIDLVDIYISSERRTYTFAADDQFRLRDSPPLQVVDWDGEDEGPYRMLNLGVVPDNILQSSPANYLYHLDTGINQIWRKVLRQSERQKVVTALATSGESEDINNFRDANDGDAIPIDPEAIQEIRTGGPDNQQIGTAQLLSQLFDRGAGNLQTRLGLGPSADTASQDQLIQGATSRVSASQQAAFRDFATGLVKELGRMLFEDPATEYGMELDIPGSSLKIPTNWESADAEDARDGEWNDYDYCIEPNSLPYRSQAERATDLINDVSTVAQLGPMLMQMGGDLPAFISTLSDLHDLPRLKEIFAQVLEPQQQAAQQGPHMQLPGQKPNGNYTRRNVGSGSMDNSAIQQLMSQPSGDAA